MGKIFYSETARGFYMEDIHGENIPNDSIEIDSEKHEELLLGQSKGFQIIATDDGKPTLEFPEDTRSYAQKRSAEYPPMADYLDAIVKGDEKAMKNYINACLAVKEKYPK